MAEKEVSLRTGYKDVGLKTNIKAIANEFRGVKNEFVTGQRDADRYAAGLENIRSRALGLAGGLDRTSQEYAQLTGVAAGATRELERQSRAVGGGGGGLVSNIRSAVAAFGEMQSSIFFVTNNLQTLMGIGRNVFNALSEGARQIELTNAFAQQIRDTGLSVDAFVARLDEAAGGTINDFDLMAGAARSMSLGVSGDVEVIAQLLEIARFKARQFGLDTSTAFNDIVTGLGRGSPLILDNLGITLDLEQAYADYAAQLGTTASKLTDAEKKQAILNDTLRAGMDEIANAGGLIDSEADKLRAMEVQWEKATAAALKYAALTAGRTISSPTGENRVESFFQDAAASDALRAASDAVDQQTGDALLATSLNIKILMGDLEGLRLLLSENSAASAIFNQALLNNAAAFGLTNQQAIQLITGVDRTNAAYTNSADVMARVNGLSYQKAAATQTMTLADIGAANASDALAVVLDRVRVIGFGAANALGLVGNAATGMAGQMISAIGAVDALGGAINRLNAARAGSGPQGAYESARFNLRNATNQLGQADTLSERINALAGVTEARNAVASAEATIRSEHERTKEAYKATKAAEVRYATGAATAGVGAARTAAAAETQILEDRERAHEELYNNIRGYADRALSFRGGVGQYDALLESVGQRSQNESDEVIRRLEDVRDRALEGNRSFWADYYKIEGSDLQQIAGNAQAAIVALQSGQDYAKYLDRDKVLQNIRDFIKAEQEAEAYKASLVNDLLPEFGGEAQAAVDKLFGGAAPGTASTENAGALAQSFATAFTTAIEAQKAQFEGAGVSVVDHMIEGGIKNIEGGAPSRMIIALRDFITAFALDQVGT